MDAAHTIRTVFMMVGGIAGAVGVVLFVAALARTSKGLGVTGAIMLVFGGGFFIAGVRTSTSEPAVESSGSGSVSDGELAARQARASFTTVITEFHDDIVAGRIDAAYARLAPMYQANVPPETFARVAKHPAFAAGVTYDMRGSTVTRGLAKVSGFLAGPSGPASVDLRCTNVDGVWRISGVFVDGVAALP